MHRFIDGEDRMQQALLPHSLERDARQHQFRRGASEQKSPAVDVTAGAGGVGQTLPH